MQKQRRYILIAAEGETVSHHVYYSLDAVMQANEFLQGCGWRTTVIVDIPEILALD